MFWPFVLVTGLCIAPLKLGAATVMVNVLSMALTGSLLVIAGLAALSLWQWYRARRLCRVTPPQWKGDPLRIFSAIAAAVIVASLYFVWVGRVPPPDASSITDGPVVTHIKGGLLEVSTIHATELFEASAKERLLGVPIGQTVTRIRVPAVYRYHVELGTDFRVLLRDKTFAAISPPVMPSLPVAIDTAQLQAEASGHWSFLTGTQRIEALQESITRTLAVKAVSPAYVELQREAARQPLKEFVARWLITQEQWKASSGYPIRVFFADEPIQSLSTVPQL